ncbi:MAG: hypothetical protein AMXMBFR84_29430 [Candidatus Hydrogenedentota bacterium]
MGDNNSSGPDGGQYSAESLRRYEWIFGKNYLSSGALEVAEKAAKWFELQTNSRVLDVGSGLGGTAIHFAQVHGATVTGLDVLAQMKDEASKRAEACGLSGIDFLTGDIVNAPLPRESFNAVYSKDSFLHVHDKRALAKALYRVLVPGGRLFFADYLRGVDRGGVEFEAYASASHYALATAHQYTDLLQDAGFADVKYEDATPRLIQILRADIKFMTSRQSDPHAPGNADIEYLADRWELKIRCLRSGEMKWGIFKARRNEA